MMYYPTYQELKEFNNKGFNYLPVGIKKKISLFDPVKLLNNIKKEEKYNFILESSKIGRYTYIGSDPLYIIRGKNSNTSIIHREGKREDVIGNPLNTLKKIMDLYTVPKIKKLPKFYGGAVGYLSYDMVKYYETLPDTAKDDLKLPDLYFMIYDKLWIYDNRESELYYIEYIEVKEGNDLKKIYHDKIKEIESIFYNVSGKKDIAPEDISISKEKIERTVTEKSYTQEEFTSAVNKVKKYISEGDVFQVNISIRHSRQLRTAGINIYRHLRHINPSPYMGYLNLNDIQLVSASPELLIEINGKTIQTRPIAGTRPRGNNEIEDKKLVHELISNEKETAEHIMLVDLERNDLGRVCKYGTVKVNELMAVEKYSHVIHIVSNVIGEIDSQNDIYNCIKATFPGGTITGAPKIRTMEIIEELEPVKRGPYTGSMGWIGFNSNLELNILIRTLVIKDGVGYIQAGAGIVIDSIPENEYIESLNKAEALWVAVESSER